MKYIYLIFSVLCLHCCSSYAVEQKSHVVLVSIAPYKFFVERIAGESVKVELMVPPGASAHTYEPSPKQMLRASQGDIWFKIGESFEKRAIEAIQSHRRQLQVVDLRQGLDLIPYDSESQHKCSHYHEGCNDPHIWLSPKLVKIQAQTIAKALSDLYPEHKQEYNERLSAFEKELDGLDKKINEILKVPHNRVVMVSHPAYAYFCRDYQFKQLSIEFEGKDPTLQQMTKVLQEAKKYHITKIFIQIQYNSKGARLIAQQIGAEVETLNPYGERYEETMLEIAKAFASAPPQ